jgi:5'-nucleotidase/UDP-sugar diphosphatase
MIKRSLLFVAAICLLLFLGAPLAAAAPEDGSQSIKIYFTSDVLSQVRETEADGTASQAGYAKWAAFIKEDSQDAAGVIILDGGNVFQGAPFASLTKGESIAQILQAIGYDTIAPGNHDFNYGQDALDALAQQSGARILAANIKQDGQIRYASSMIKEIEDIKIGVVGLTSPSYSTIIDPYQVQGLDFGDDESILKDAQAAVDQLKIDGADIIIAVTHLGTNAADFLSANDVARKVTGIDLIFDGGNSQAALIAEKGVLIVNVGQNLAHAAAITIREEGDGFRFDPYIYSAEELAQYTADSQVQQIIDEVNQAQEAELATKIGSTPIFLDGERESVRSQDTNLARLITSSMKEAAAAEISLLNGGSIRASIDQGQITKQDIYSSLLFSNMLVTKNIKGNVLLQVLEQGLEPGKGSFLHFAGLVVEYEKISETAADGQVTSYNKITKVMVNDKPLDTEQEYSVAMSNFLANGGDGYDLLAQGELTGQYGSLTTIFMDFMGKKTDAEIMDIDQESRLVVANASDHGLWGSILAILIIVCAALIIIYIIINRKRRKRIF